MVLNLKIREKENEENSRSTFLGKEDTSMLG